MCTQCCQGDGEEGGTGRNGEGLQGRVQAARWVSSSQVRPFCEKGRFGEVFLHYSSHANKKSGVELNGGEVWLARESLQLSW